MLKQVRVTVIFPYFLTGSVAALVCWMSQSPFIETRRSFIYFLIWISSFSPQMSICANCFQTVNSCNPSSSFFFFPFLPTQPAENFFCVDAQDWNAATRPCRMRCRLLQSDRGTLQGLINNSWGFVSHDLWDLVSHSPRRGACLPLPPPPPPSYFEK